MEMDFSLSEKVTMNDDRWDPERLSDDQRPVLLAFTHFGMLVLHVCIITDQ